MANGEAHSLFSASGADAWSVCPGKPAMEVGRKTTSEYADEGTAAHTLASWVMADRIDGGSRTARDWMGEKIVVRNWDQKSETEVRRTYTVDSDMAEHVDTYVDRFMLMANAANAERFCEQRVHYHEHLGVEKALAWGTSDGVALIFDTAHGDELQVHDLKYGRGVLVEADTMQLKLYAVGALWEFGHLADIRRVRLVIHQPRKEWVDELVLDVDELLVAVAELRDAVPRVVAAMAIAEKLRAAGYPPEQVAEALYLEGYLATSDKGCRFCDAKAICPAMINDVGTVLSGREKVRPEDFADLTIDSPEDVRKAGGNYLVAAYHMAERAEAFFHAVRAEIDRRVLLNGEQFDGIKVVAGKKGRREWTDAGEAEALAASAPAPIRALLYKTVLQTPTQILDKALKTSPVWAMKFASLVTQREGKPAVVPHSDARPAISHRAVKEDFENLDEVEPQPARGPGAAAGRDRHPFRD